jgi:hypothetical protein
MQKIPKRQKKCSLEDLATAYDTAHSGRKARTLPFDVVIKWAKESGHYIIRRGCFYEDVAQPPTQP